MPDIICADCGAPRQNARYKNTLYCNHCRLLRDVRFYVQPRECKMPKPDGKGHCDTAFLPAVTRDHYCMDHALGNGIIGRCLICDKTSQELIRPRVPICIRCVRDPKLRKKVIAGLRNGQALRREKHGWESPADNHEL